MKRTLSKAEMLNLWRYARTAEPLRLDCTATRTEGTGVDAMFEQEMRAWYLTQLDEAPPELLVPEEMADQAQLKGKYGAVHVVLPESVRRILSVEFDGWPSAISPDDDAMAVRRAALNPYCRRPMAARLSPREVIVSAPRGVLSSVVAIVDPGPERYVFDEKLWLISN